MASKHLYDSNKSYEMGQTAETLFNSIAVQNKWNIRTSSRDDDYYDHWDFEISKTTAESNLKYKVEVKARKRINRYDNAPNDKWTWVELHGNGETHRGWLYGSKANLIAFETATGFVLIDREKLISLVEEVVKDVYVKRASDAQYCLYSRNGQYDLVTLIETKHIIDNAWAIWTKEQ